MARLVIEFNPIPCPRTPPEKQREAARLKAKKFWASLLESSKGQVRAAHKASLWSRGCQIQDQVDRYRERVQPAYRWVFDMARNTPEPPRVAPRLMFEPIPFDGRDGGFARLIETILFAFKAEELINAIQRALTQRLKRTGTPYSKPLSRKELQRVGAFCTGYVAYIHPSSMVRLAIERLEKGEFFDGKLIE